MQTTVTPVNESITPSPSPSPQPKDINVLRHNAEGRLVAGVTCASCRAQTNAITGVEEAREEDRRLVMAALTHHRKSVKKQEAEDGVKVFKELRWVEHRNPENDSGNFVCLFVGDKRFNNVMAESDKDDLIELSKLPHMRHLQREVARWWAASCLVSATA
jgi:hypothetical protein